MRSMRVQGPDEADGNSVHLLRHTHGKRGAAGGQDRTESTTGVSYTRSEIGIVK